MHVVERDKKWTVLSERTHDREERNPEQACVQEPLVRLPQEQCDLESAPLNRHQPRQRRVQHRCEEITDGCERDLCLGIGRARRQKAEAAFTGEAKPLVPERGLADSCIPLEQQRLPTRRYSLEERLECLQLLPPADDLGCHRTLPAGPPPTRVSRHTTASRQSVSAL